MVNSLCPFSIFPTEIPQEWEWTKHSSGMEKEMYGEMEVKKSQKH